MTSGIGHPSFYPGLSVTTTSTSSSPAEKAGIKINDVILKINGRDIVGSESAISEFIGTIRTNANKEIILEVLRNPDSRTTKDLEGSKLDGVYTAKIDRIALVPVEGTRLIPDFAFASAAVTTSAPASALLPPLCSTCAFSIVAMMIAMIIITSILYSLMILHCQFFNAPQPSSISYFSLYLSYRLLNHLSPRYCHLTFYLSFLIFFYLQALMGRAV